MSTELVQPAGHWGVDTAWVARLAVQLAHDRLVLAGSFPGAVDGEELVVATDTGSLRATGRVWSEHDLELLVVQHDGLDLESECSVGVPGRTASACAVPVPGTDVGALLRTGVAALPPKARAELLAFLVDSCLGERLTTAPTLAENFHALRQALRPRRKAGLIAADADRGLKVEVIAAIDDSHFYLRGWIGHPVHALKSVVAVSPEGARTELMPALYRYQRDDVAQFYGEDEDRCSYGFASQFLLDVPSGRRADWVVEVTPIDGAPVEDSAPEVVDGIEAVRDLLIGDLAIERSPMDEFRRNEMAPAIGRLLRRAEARVHLRRVEQLGSSPQAPDVTIVVPLYKRIDFVEHQLAQFADDPEVRSADLLYVLDSPELGESLVAEAHRLYRLYQVPFRLALLSHNGGFSVANNFGASEAHGRLLVLMNSDVLPDKPGWLGELTTFYDSVPDVGAVAPKLVYEDESIQHAGMYFERLEGSRLWSNEHYFKGLHRSFAPACTPRPVPAVTAACMMISAELYRRFGGLRGMFVQGDFEDSDLCLRMSEAGFQHWYAAHVELYHLEGQSYASWQRTANAEFNRWLHTDLWDATIDSVMNHYGPSGSSTIPAVVAKHA